MLILRLMRGGSLQSAQEQEQQQALAWHNRCGMTDKHCPVVRQQLFSNRCICGTAQLERAAHGSWPGLGTKRLFLCAAERPRRGLQVATDVAEALHFLHTELQIMHSDLSGA